MDHLDTRARLTKTINRVVAACTEASGLGLLLEFDGELDGTGASLRGRLSPAGSSWATGHGPIEDVLAEVEQELAARRERLRQMRGLPQFTGNPE